MGNSKLSSSNTPKLQKTPAIEPNRSQSLGQRQTGGAFEASLQQALLAQDLVGARSMVANAEAVLAAHARTTTSETLGPSVPQSQLSAAKARIAMTAGDPSAARAILVQAIERWPNEPPLRAMMTEVMLANGRAKDVRPVLTHLGRAPAPYVPGDQSNGGKKDSAG